MKERPILFSAPMVREILAGTKTQTRRIVKPQPEFRENAGLCWKGVAYGITTDRQPYVREFLKHCPYGAPGDRLWVRETWYCDDYTANTANDFASARSGYVGRPPSDERIIEQWRRAMDYRADHDCHTYEAGCPCADEDGRSSWKPSIHMPRWASRITLEVTGVRVERLQEISEADIIAGGCTVDAVAKFTGVPWSSLPTLHDAWQAAWEHINGRESWAANPWLWCVSFRRIEAQERAA